MDTRLSAEQVALRDSAAAVVDRLGPATVRQLDDAERTAKLAAAVAASGWHELRSGDGSGRPVASAVEAAIVAEELGRGLADAAFVGPTLAAELRRLAGAPPATSLETVALEGDLGALAGEGEAVAVDVANAHRALLAPAGPTGRRVVAVDVAGWSFGGADLTRPVAVVAGDAPREEVADQQRPLSDDDVARWSALGLALGCADLVGVMRGAIELTCTYARARRQFGVAIGSFQAVQHLLADAQVAMEGSRSLALHAAWAVDSLAPQEAVVAASLAKAYCARAGRAVCETAIQVHGGIGNTWDCLAHVFLRRALHSADLLGGVGPSLARLRRHHGLEGGDGLR